MKDKDWFPSKKLIDETALKMREAYRNGHAAEYKLRRNSLLTLLYSDVQQSIGAYENENKNALYIYFLDLLSDDITLKWAKKDDMENQSFTGYLSTTLKWRSSAQTKMGKQGYDIDTIINRKTEEVNSDVSAIVQEEDGNEFLIYEKAKHKKNDNDKIYAPEMQDDNKISDMLNLALDKMKFVIEKTKQKNSKICKRTFSSEQIMLYYIPYSDGRLLKQVSTQFEAVTYYSLFGFLMESDIIDPATVNSIDDIFKCHVPRKYYTKEGKEIKMIPHSVTCEYLKKFHEVEKTASQLSDIYRSYMEAMNMTRYHN